MNKNDYTIRLENQNDYSEVENLVNVDSTNAGIDVTKSTVGEDIGNGDNA